MLAAISTTIVRCAGSLNNVPPHRCESQRLVTQCASSLHKNVCASIQCIQHTSASAANAFRSGKSSGESEVQQQSLWLCARLSLPTAGRESGSTLQRICKPGYGERCNHASNQQEQVGVYWRQQLEGAHCSLCITHTHTDIHVSMEDQHI